MDTTARILYCHCAYAQVVPKAVKEEVLRKLSESGMAFDAVADLCEMSARRDPALKQMADSGTDNDKPVNLKIAACFPRAVKWLFSAADATLPEQGVEVLNMRVETADRVAYAILGEGFGNPGMSQPSSGQAASGPKELT